MNNKSLIYTTVLFILLYTLCVIDASMVTCKSGKLTNIAETSWREDEVDTTIMMIETLAGRFRNNDNMLNLNNKRKKVLKLGNDVTNSTIDWNNYHCYSCIIHNPKNSLPYITECDGINYNSSSIPENTSNIIICKELNRNVGLSNILRSEVKESHIMFHSKKIHTLTVLVCIIKSDNYSKLFGYFGYFVAALIFIIMMFPIIMIYNMYLNARKNEIVDHEIYYDNSDSDYIKLLIK
ncbi:SWPV1-051 [Shearwaterpox virus]|uniref:SWPV1-051 n=1 Tax=Shearwaterpox virus TaxID=1974596 RepID=A0A1V0S7R1_CNPV|nr:SWPV1-051 [Shearwaterpox virus]